MRQTIPRPEGYRNKERERNGQNNRGTGVLPPVGYIFGKRKDAHKNTCKAPRQLTYIDSLNSCTHSVV